MSSSVMRSQALFAASISRLFRTSRTSFSSCSVILATCAPRRGFMTTRPSCSSMRIASRTGVLDTPSLLASAISMSRSPGCSSPFKIAFLSVRKTTSRSGRNSLISLSEPIAVIPFLLWSRQEDSRPRILSPHLITAFQSCIVIIEKSENGRPASAHDRYKRACLFHF